MCDMVWAGVWMLAGGCLGILAMALMVIAADKDGPP